MSSQRIAIDSLEFTGRFKTQPRRSSYERRPTILLQRSGQISDFVKPPSIVEQPEDFASSSQSNQNFDAFRQLASPAPTQTTHFKKQFDAPPKPKKPVLSIVASVLVSVLFVVGVGTALLQLRTNKHVAAQVQQANNAEPQSEGIHSLEETKPSDLGSYSVSPGQPRYIRIAKLDLAARIRKVGVKANNELVAPTNIHDAG